MELFYKIYMVLTCLFILFNLAVYIYYFIKWFKSNADLQILFSRAKEIQDMIKDVDNSKIEYEITKRAADDFLDKIYLTPKKPNNENP